MERGWDFIMSLPWGTVVFPWGSMGIGQHILRSFLSKLYFPQYLRQITDRVLPLSVEHSAPQKQKWVLCNNSLIALTGLC
jgi:hypothetical protein